MDLRRRRHTNDDTETVERTLPSRLIAYRAAHWGLWSLVALGAVGGAASLVRPPSTAVASTVPAPNGDEGVPVDVAGFAELAVRHWVDASEESPDLDGLFVGDVELRGVDAGARRAVGASTVGARPIGEGYWAVTVAVEVLEADTAGVLVPAGVWHVEVGIVRGDDGSLGAVGTPALVPAPATAASLGVAGPALRARQADDPLAAAVEGLLGAMLTGTGDLARYLAPDTLLTPVDPPPFSTVVVERIAATDGRSGTVVRVQVRATSAAGHDQVLGYEVALAERAGRWEARSVSGAPTLEPTTPSVPSSPASTAPTEPPSPATETTFRPPVAEPGA